MLLHQFLTLINLLDFVDREKFLKVIYIKRFVDIPSMGNLESTSLPNIACVAPCNSAMAFSNVITKVSQNIDRNEERAQDSEMKDKFSVEWKQVYLDLL